MITKKAMAKMEKDVYEYNTALYKVIDIFLKQEMVKIPGTYKMECYFMVGISNNAIDNIRVTEVNSGTRDTNKEKFEEWLFSTKNVDIDNLMGSALIDEEKFNYLFNNIGVIK